MLSLLSSFLFHLYRMTYSNAIRRETDHVWGWESLISLMQDATGRVSKKTFQHGWHEVVVVTAVALIRIRASESRGK